MGFETVTGQRADKPKGDRKQRERKDSLDDYSSGSESDVEVILRQKREEKKEAKKRVVEVEETKPEKKSSKKPQPVVEEESTPEPE